MPFPTRQLGKNGPTVSAIGFGAMGIGAFYGKTEHKDSLSTLTFAADRGLTFWDTANIYGNSEDVLGEWFATTGRRSDIFLATKFGAMEPGTPIADHKPISKPSHIIREFNRSLKRLQTDYIDLYYQHRVDPEVPIEIVLETLRPFIEKGQIKWIGLSECSIATLKRAKAVKGLGEKVIAAQMEFSPFELSLERSGFVDAINEAGMALVAFSPLGRGLVTGRFKSPADFEEDDLRRFMPRFSEENFPKNLKVVEELTKIANHYEATTAQIALAWILAEHPNFVPIPGSRNVKRTEENARGAEIQLTTEDVKAIRAVVETAEVGGERHTPGFVPQGDCIALSEWKGEH